MKAKCIATWGDGETCDRDTRALGLCAAHWAQQDRKIPFHAPRAVRKRGGGLPLGAPCPVTVGDWTCGRPVHGVSLCATHARHKRDGKPFAVIDLPGRTAKATAAAARRATERPTTRKATP